MAQRLSRFEIESFKAFKDATAFELDGRSLLVYGENGAGKSSVYEALKLTFFYQRIKDANSPGATPEEKQQRWESYLSGKYNNRGGGDFSIKVGNDDYLTFISSNDYADYHVSMISNENIQINSSISYKDLLHNVYFDGDVDQILGDEAKTKKIAEAVNKDLEDAFKEIGVKVAISHEDDLKCAMKGPWGEDTYIENIRDYFNEAIINLVVLVLLFNTIKVLEEKGNGKVNILILDDIITSLDASNRMLLMRYVQKEFPEYQKFIFTHNISFYNLWLYTIGQFKQSVNWVAYNIYDCAGKHKIYTYKKVKKVEKTDCQKLRERLESGEEDLQNLGNDIRRKFEELLHEFAKIVHVGGKNECSNILDRLESNKTVYLVETDNHRFKDANDMIDHIHGIIGLEMNDVLKKTLRRKYGEYHANKFFRSIMPVIQELKMYQKLSMHPLSHAHLHGTPTYTEKELSITIALLTRFEEVVDELMNFDISTV